MMIVKVFAYPRSHPTAVLASAYKPAGLACSLTSRDSEEKEVADRGRENEGEEIDGKISETR